MLSQRIANIVFLTVVLAAAAYFAWVAEGFVAAGLLASSGVPSKFFPQLLLGGIAICAGIVLIEYIVRGAAGGDGGKTVYGAPVDARRGLLTLAATVAAYVIWRIWGYVPMALFLGPATLLAMGVRNPVIYAVVPGLAGLVYLTFTRLLGTQL